MYEWVLGCPVNSIEQHEWVLGGLYIFVYIPLLKIINEVLNMGESKNYIRGRLKIVSEILNLTEAKNYTRARFKTIIEAINISEAKNWLRIRQLFMKKSIPFGFNEEMPGMKKNLYPGFKEEN